MKQSFDLRAVKSAVAIFFNRYHTLLFFLVISAGIAACLLTVMSILSLSGKIDSAIATPTNQSFDEGTIKKVEALKSADNQSSYTIQGRQSPFGE